MATCVLVRVQMGRDRSRLHFSMQQNVGRISREIDSVREPIAKSMLLKKQVLSRFLLKICII
jgi:hypothetical protein